MEQLASHWTNFHKILYLSIFQNSVERNQVPLKSDNNKEHFTWRPRYILNHISLNSSYNENVSDKSCIKTTITRFAFSNSPPRKSCRLWENVENCCRAGQATEDNMVHANTCTGCVTITDFPLKQWLHECATMLRYTYTACFLIRNLSYGWSLWPLALDARRSSCATALERVPWHITYSSDLDIHLVLMYSGANSMFFLS